MLPRRLRFIRRAGPLCRLVVAITLLAGFSALLVWALSTGDNGLPSRLYPSTHGRRLAPDRQPVDLRGDDKGRRSAVKDKRRRSVKHSAGRSHYEEVVDDRHSGVAARWLSHRLLPWFFTNGTEWPRPSSKLSRLAILWPDPESPHDDRITSQLMYLPPGYLNRTSENERFVKGLTRLAS
ncbi:hypothetical protein HPB51_021120 [Rhipicephalus microplus]|uniref:Uncharacterized protein n=1 Tax=Rhipicephalus microplus TaxID=6941 RepID=A0A9J6DWU7_RHIMP|nr:hypothetical protein HPB51_021120 [Rhipicephalus microplus]